MYDDRNYTVTSINGYRRQNMTREQAIDHAKRLEAAAPLTGWRGKAHIFYRSGAEVTDWRDDS